MARKKLTNSAMIKTLDEANEALAVLADLQRQRELIINKANEQIDGLKRAAAVDEAPLVARQKQLEAALHAFAEINKAELFKQKKTQSLAFGEFGYRQSTSLCLVKGFKWPAVIEKLKALKKGGVRTTEDVDKDVLKKWPAERLAEVGTKTVSKDTFWYEIKQITKLNEGANA